MKAHLCYALSFTGQVSIMATVISDKLDRRAAILQAAREVLAAKGLEATRVSEIVARAGVAQGTFYLYFPSKSSLVMTLTEEMNVEMMAALQQCIAEATSLAEVIGKCVRATFGVMGRYRDILGLIHSRIGLSEMNEMCIEMDKPFYGFVANMIRAGQDSGEVSAAVNPDIAGQLIVGLIEHAAQECYVFQSQTPTEAYIAEMTRFVGSALGIA